MYSNFEDLNKNELHGKDYQIKVITKPESDIAIIAPHGGLIERETSEIAKAIAAEDFNLYLFEGIKFENNYESLHLTSHIFDEPQCLELISTVKTVVSIHGCNGKEEKIFLGGLDIKIKKRIANAFDYAGFHTYTENHPYPGTNPKNICNRGTDKKGVQIELTDPLRNTNKKYSVIDTLRNELLKLSFEPSY